MKSGSSFLTSFPGLVICFLDEVRWCGPFSWSYTSVRPHLSGSWMTQLFAFNASVSLLALCLHACSAAIAFPSKMNLASGLCILQLRVLSPTLWGTWYMASWHVLHGKTQLRATIAFYFLSSFQKGHLFAFFSAFFLMSNVSSWLLLPVYFFWLFFLLHFLLFCWVDIGYILDFCPCLKIGARSVHLKPGRFFLFYTWQFHCSMSLVSQCKEKGSCLVLILLIWEFLILSDMHILLII